MTLKLSDSTTRTSDLKTQVNSTQAAYHNLFLQEAQQTRIIESVSVGQSRPEHVVAPSGELLHAVSGGATLRRYFKAPLCRIQFQQGAILLRRPCHLEFQSPNNRTPPLLSEGRHQIGERPTMNSQTELLDWDNSSEGEKPENESSNHGLASADSGCGE